MPLEWYTYRGIQRLTRGWPHTQKLLVRRGYWVLMGGLVVSLLITFQVFRTEHRMTNFAEAMVNATLTMLATKLVFVLVLSEAFDGFTITQLSDIHSGSFALSSRKAVQRGVDLAQAQESDLFLFTGDLVNNMAKEVEPWLDTFGQLRAPYGQFSTLGNHDYGEYISWPSEAAKAADLELLMQYHEVMGYQLLNNTHVMLEKDGQQLALLGVENWGTGFIRRGDLDAALAGVDKSAFKVLMSHDPSHWEMKVKNHPTPVQLTLAGHTHGMQMGVELPGWKWSPIQYRYPHWAGWAEVNRRQLYVNRGFGFLGFSGRVGIWPEVTVLELRRRVV